jgi:hypothetical protein
MKMKKTIWIPIAIGMVSAVLILAASEAKFSIPLGNGSYIGIGELFTTLSAALGGPLASIVTLFMGYSIHGILHPEFFPDLSSVYIFLGDGVAHLCAMLVFAFCYYKFLFPRMSKTRVFLIGWFLLVGAYYFLALLPLTVVFLNLIDPGQGATYTVFAKNFIPEFLGTAIFTTLVWFASPVRYRRPHWIEPKNAPDHIEGI